MSLIPKFYMDAVVSIGVRNTTSIDWIGTGFFVIKPLGNDHFQPFLITNQHVIDGLGSIVIRMKENDNGNLRIIDMPLVQNGKKLYSVHGDKNVDIAVVLLNGSFIKGHNLQFSAFNIEQHALSAAEHVRISCRLQPEKGTGRDPGGNG